MNYFSFDYPGFSVNVIPAFSDNYIYIIQCSQTDEAVILDPGESKPVLQFLEEFKITPSQIWITHRHRDHVNGISGVLKKFPSCKIFGPEDQKNEIPCIQTTLKEGDLVIVGSIQFSVLSTPGHLIGDISYYNQSVVFTADSLFMAGCGKIFSGDYHLMYETLNKKLAVLDEKTAIFCGHEYTTGNLKFALAVEPSNPDTQKISERVKKLREKGFPSLPSSIGDEKKINPFLRTNSEEIARSLETEFGKKEYNPQKKFQLLRNWKDRFK